MDDSETALEHLTVIRGLMEKATVYRTVTAPTALFGGCLALLTAGILWGLDRSLTPPTCIGVWIGVLIVVNAFNHGFIWKTAQRAGEPYLSSGLRMALKAITPALFAGGVLGLALGLGPQQDLPAATLAWTTFYGLALLATHGFSPRSLRVLGFAFTMVGSLLLAAHWAWPASITTISPQRLGAAIMGFTFGGFHLVYGFAIFRDRQRLKDV